jgi:hypothetical protein
MNKIEILSITTDEGFVVADFTFNDKEYSNCWFQLPDCADSQHSMCRDAKENLSCDDIQEVVDKLGSEFDSVLEIYALIELNSRYYTSKEVEIYGIKCTQIIDTESEDNSVLLKRHYMSNYYQKTVYEVVTKEELKEKHEEEEYYKSFSEEES